MKSSARLLRSAGMACLSALAVCLAPSHGLGQGNFSFTAPGPVTILDVSAAQPYPSSVTVSSVPGAISRLSVTLLGFQHTFPDDVDVLLVSPGGQKVMLMSDAGGGGDVAGLNLRFEESALGGLPDNGLLTAGSFRPTDFEPGDSLPSPAPAGPYGSSLNAFVGTAPNGVWSLYVVDDRGDDAGQVVTGWRLDLTTVNPATATDLALGVNDAPDPVMAGQPLTLTVTITNRGPLAATSLRLTNTLPPNVTFQSATSPQGSCAQAGGIVNCAFSSLGVNATAQVNITMVPVSVGTITNTTRISGAQADLVPANNSIATVTTVSAATVADLRLGLTDRPSPLVLGSNVIYAISVTNAGPLTATATVVSNLLPPSVTLLSATTSTGSCGAVGNRVTCQLGDLPSGASALVTVVAQTLVPGLITNTVRVYSSMPDLTPATATVVTRVDESADLAVSLIEPFDPVAIGNPVTYTLIVSNLGVNAARQVSLVETLPVGVAFRSALPSQGTCQNLNGVLVCSLGTLSNGASATVLVDLQPLSLQTMVSGITVSSPVPDPNLANNQITETTTTFPVATGTPLGTGIQIVRTNDPAVMANALTSAGLTGLRVTSSRLKGWATTNLSTSGLYFVGAIPSTFGLTRGGVVLSTGTVQAYQTGPNLLPDTTTAFNRPADAELEALLTPITGFGIVDFDHFDATLFEVKFDMLPGYDRVEFQVVFASEEWPDIVVPFLDGFGIYLNGTNIAFSGGLPINVLHPDMADSMGTELDGVLAPGGDAILSFSAPVPAGSSNNVLQFVLGDTSDPTIDTTVYISSFEGAQSPNADLSLSITSAPAPVIVGSNLTYTITVQNLGPYMATNVVVATLIPPQVTFIDVQGSQGAGCAIFGDLINCFLGDLNRGATATVSLLVQPTGAGFITNAALVVSDLADFSSANDYAETESTVVEFGTFGNLGPLPIFDATTALPYPSVIHVSGLTGVVTRVSVRLEELSHTYPADLDVMLADPSGRRVMLMSDAGWDFPVDAVSLQFGEDGFDGLPQFDPIVSGTYAPTDHEPGDAFLGFPAGFSYGLSMTDLTGRSPNGDWSLYIMDDRGVDTGVLGRGWRLILETGPEPGSPTLSIRRVGDMLELTWPESASAFFLEATPVLGAGAVWTPVAATPVVGGGLVTVTLPLAGNGNAFYRLRL